MTTERKLVSVREAARQLGLDKSTVSRQVGRIFPNHGGPGQPLIDVDEARAARARLINPLLARRRKGARAPAKLPPIGLGPIPGVDYGERGWAIPTYLGLRADLDRKPLPLQVALLLILAVHEQGWGECDAVIGPAVADGLARLAREAAPMTDPAAIQQHLARGAEAIVTDMRDALVAALDLAAAAAHD